MQKTKRKASEPFSTSLPKMKKVQFNTSTDLVNKKEKKIKPLNTRKKDFKREGIKKTEKHDKSGHKKFVSKANKFSKNQTDGEKPKWSEMKKEKKNLRVERRKAKASAEIFEISHKAKLLSAQIQRKTVKQEFRINACKELHILIKGQYKAIALTHDLSRVIQVLLKHSPEDTKNEITEELMDIIVQMMQSKYAHYAVKRILKYGTDFIRHEVIKKLFGHIVSLASHSVSAPVLDYAYGEFANKKEKINMQQEFYGDMYKNTKDTKVKTLSDAYKDCPEMKSAILQSCRANIQRILDKNLHDGELFHSVLYDYIRECSSDDRIELISTLSPLIVPLSNSLPGVNTACMCVWQGTNKDKKSILKVVKEHVVSLSKHKTGYRLLITIFDSVDDTVLVKKTIVSTLVNNIQDIARDHWGNMTLHWLVKPKDPAAFHPTFIKFLKEGYLSGTSKKDAEVREAELREAILPELKSNIESEAAFWVADKTRMLLVVTVLSIETSKSLLVALAKEICNPNWMMSKENKDTSVLAIEDAGIHMCLKKLAVLDKTASETLAEAICKIISDDTLKSWLATNRGCFFVLKLIESNTEDIAKKIKKTVKPYLNVLKQQETEGAKLLLQCIQK